MFVELVPFTLLSLCAVAVTLEAQSLGGIRTAYYGESLWESVLLVPTLWLTYLGQILFPVGLSALYDEKIIASFSMVKTVSVLIFLALTVWKILHWMKRNQKTCLFWLSWSLVGLLPVSHLIPMVTIMNDRYLYFPVVGIFVLLAGALYEGFSRVESSLMRFGVQFLTILIVPILTFSASERVKVWADDLTLWNDAVLKFPNQAKARSNLGTCFLSVNDNERATAEFKRAVEIDPNLYVGRVNLGASYLKTNNPWAAVEELERAVELFDGDPKAHYYLGMAYHRSGRNGPAIEELRWVVDRFPMWSEVVLNLIRVYQQTGSYAEAETLIESGRKRFRHNIQILSELNELDKRFLEKKP